MENAPREPSTRQTPPIRRLDVERLLEAVLFVGGDPIDAAQFVAAFPSLAPSDFDAAIRRLQERYRFQRRPYAVRRTAAGYVLTVERRHLELLQAAEPPDRGVKLSRQVIEVLSVVAYKQPIDRQSIEKILGLDVGPSLRQLVKRRLIARVETDESPGGEERFVTTSRFLELFRLESVDELPVAEDQAL